MTRGKADDELRGVLASIKDLWVRGTPDYASTVNSVVAKNTLHLELERFDDPQQVYDLTPEQRDRLLAHGRQDAAHALLNTINILREVQQLRQTLRTIIVFAIVAVAAGIWYGWFR